MPPTKTRRSARPGRGNNPARVAAVPALRQAVLYARVSSREQEREGFSIPAQQAILKKYANDNGFAIVEEFIDVETAKKSGRAAFTRMMALLKKRAAKPPVVLVEKTDRLYRNLKDWVALDELKVDVHFVKEGIVLSDESRSSEKFIHGIKVLMAKNYVDNLSEEVRKGMVQKCEEGGYPGRAPLGYLNRRENGRAFLEIDPERALLVRNLFELYDRGGHSIEALATYAQQSGLRGNRGGRLSTSVIHNILRNPLYAGRFWWGGQEYQSSEPRIIPWELFQRVQDRLDGHPYTRARKLEFAFSGLVTCGWCGAAVTAEVRKEKYVYYHCAKRCRRESFIPEARLSEMFAAHVRRLQLPEDIREAFIASLRSSRRDIEQDARERLVGAQTRLERLGKLIDAAYEDKLEGRIDDDFFQAKRAEWERQRAEAADEIQRLTTVSAKTLDTAIEVFKLANRAYDLMITREPREQRRLLDVLLSNSTLAEGRLSVTWRKPFDLLALSPDPDTGDGGDPGSQDRRHSVWSG
ncbi:MAG: recombinase family protein [Alphaproteobacteria bacterium]|nr:recombinase family protein [Alphaproteobacteria bacterium]